MNDNHILQNSIHKLFDKGSAVLFRWRNDAEWSIEYVSKNVHQLLGYSQEEFLEQKISYAQRIHPDFLEHVEAEVHAAVLSGKEFFEHAPYKVITKELQEKWILDQTLIERDAEGNILSFVGYINDITKSIELKEENERLAQRVALAVESTHDGIWDWDFVTNEVFFSHYWKSMLGYSDAEVPNTPEAFYSLIHPHDQPKAQEALQKHLADPSSTYRVELRLRCKDGTFKWILSRGKALFDANNTPLRMLGSHIDIDKNKKIFHQLQEAQKIAKIGIWELYHQTGRLVWSDTVYDIFELDKENTPASYELFLSLIHPDDRDAMHNVYFNSLKTKQPYEFTHRLQLKNGYVKYLLEQCNTDFDSDGTPILSRGTVQDITEFTMLDAAMHRERRRFKAFMNNSSDGIIIFNENLRIVDFSKVAKEMLGYNDIEMLQLHLQDFDIHFDKQQLDTLLSQLSKEPISFETVHQCKDKTTYDAIITAVVIEIDDEKFIYTSTHDISEMKRLQEQILKAKQFNEKLIDGANAIITVIDDKGCMIKLNRFAQEFSGYTQEEIAGAPYKWTALLPASMQERVKSFVENAKSGEIIKHHKNAWISKTGEERIFEWSNAVVKKSDGTLDYIISIGIDITNQEEQHNFLKLLLDSQSHMLILADKTSLKYANKATLEYFCVDSAASMRLQYDCISDIFIQTPYSYYPKRDIKGAKWIEEIQKLPPEQRIVTMKSCKNSQEQSFKLSVAYYGESNTYLLTFTDISDALKKQHELEHKSYHDVLTQAFNRRYFDEHIETLLQAHKKSHMLTALAIIDIDHFKNVNDNFGHDIGDRVLKQLVTSIRSVSRESDLLVRWGGEEFLLLMPVKNVESFEKILENLRIKISTTAFEAVKQLTVSIGATLHMPDEDIEASIKRADLHLYHSKNSGRNRVTTR